MTTAKTWKNISKFRLFTIVALSLLTSLSLTMTDELWKPKDFVAAIMQAAIAGFAYLQCPTIKPEETEKKECDDGKLFHFDGHHGDSGNAQKSNQSPPIQKRDAEGPRRDRRGFSRTAAAAAAAAPEGEGEGER